MNGDYDIKVEQVSL